MKMLRKIMAVGITIAFALPFAVAADTTSARANISAAEIVAKNVAARGGLQSWRAVQTMSMEGKLGAGGNQRGPNPATPPPGKKLAVVPTDPRPRDEVQLSFTMKLQRPRKERFELLFNGQTALQVYDGAYGWKLRPYLNRREIEPFTANELKSASMQSEIDGPLVDYVAKGTRIELENTEKVEDRDAYKLKLSLKDGRAFHVWVDALTFLEAKIEGIPRVLDGVEHPVEVYYRDYRPVSGLQIPFILETKVLPVAVAGKKLSTAPVQEEKITVEKVVVNPKLDALLFSKPQIETSTSHR